MTITEIRTADAARGWTLGRGARLEEEGVRFTVWAPAARVFAAWHLASGVAAASA